ncbi:MAG: tRNA epoxyqueuosine(34) reductase QueG [Planctomycetes bacterium]|nr:tRNA epoxyqueuosine(34) reductase QueG [Planctomycetota bacterium]
MSYKEAIRATAKRLGFERVAFCAAEESPHAAYIDDWLAKGRHGTMDWLAKYPATRKDIRNRYEWARSFVMLSIDYPPELPAKLPAKSAIPNIARYARGVDYHEKYQGRLKKFEDEILKLGGPECRAMWYQDTGAFLERELAAKAGLGWVGKNTMLIDPARGSWMLLALVVTSLQLEPDAPITDHCGNCTRCLEACPTDAFPAPYQLDATRCISYLTIEHRGAIDESLRAGVGEWLFGCDICNEVCPWNSKAPKKAPELDREFAGLTLARIFTSKPEHLMKRIAGTPLERTGEAGLKRNAAIVAGNMKDESLLPSLEQALMTDDEVVQEAVIWALSQYGTKPARSALARAQKYVVNDKLRDRIIEALGGSIEREA